jgi:hypothetical protein
MGHIISRDGIKIDLNIVVAIHKISVTRRKTEVQSFLGRVNFLRSCIPNLVEIIKHITNMLRKGSEIKGTTNTKHSSKKVKEYLTKSLVLINPYFAKDFIVFSFSSKHTITGVLMKKNDQNPEQHVSLFNSSLRDSTLKYNIMEK